MQIRIRFALWSGKCEGPKDSWVFASPNGTPVDRHNITARVIGAASHRRARLRAMQAKAKGDEAQVEGFCAGRRGACIAVVEATGGNYVVAQALLGHNSMTTTLNVYKKQITPKAFKEGMEMYELATSKREEN